jgi:hypothetical protein
MNCSSLATRFAAVGLMAFSAAQAADPPATADSKAAAQSQTTNTQAAVAQGAAQAPAGATTAATAPAADAGSARSADTTAKPHKDSDLLAASVIDEGQLGNARGGAETAPANVTLNQNNTNGSVTGNVASNLTTGNNNISESSFSNAAGVPIVIQNTGNNVLIQNSTILNLQMGAPK